MATPSASNEPSGPALDDDQIRVLITIERIGAGLSMGAITVLVLSYLLVKRLRTTPNLFLFCAAIANAGASVASMMGYDGLHQGVESGLCQAQGFIFQWFMQADPWWSFAMAVNVYLVFFHNVNPTAFRKYAWLYCVICFGGPLISAIALITVRGDTRGPVFGDAVMWCWISSNWSLVRIYSYYIPVWICIFLSIIIYFAVGYHVFHHRNQLRNIACEMSEDRDVIETNSSNGKDSTRDSLNPAADFYGTAVTEVQVTTDDTDHASRASTSDAPDQLYAATSQQMPLQAPMAKLEKKDLLLAPNYGQFETICTSDSCPFPSPTLVSKRRGVKSNTSLKLRRLDPVKMAYLRTSFIFGFAVLITWIPSSINRVYSLTHNDRVSFGLSVASGCVLPLQGVWNLMIYLTTSWKPFCEEMVILKERWQKKNRDSTRTTFRFDNRTDFAGLGRRDTFERLRNRDQRPSDLESNDVELGQLPLYWRRGMRWDSQALEPKI